MFKKILFFSLFIYITSFSFKFSYISGLFNYKGFVYNPYRVFNLPPWTPMKKIKKRYNELVREYHPDKSHKDTRKEFEIIQQSYDSIKKSRKENEDNDNEINFTSVITETIRSILNVEILFVVIYMIAYITYKFQMLIIIPLFYMIFSFTFIDNMFPHFFKTEFSEYVTCVVVGFILYILHRKYISNIFKNKN